MLFHPIFIVASKLALTNEIFQQSEESEGEQVGFESVHKHKIVAKKQKQQDNDMFVNDLILT